MQKQNFTLTLLEEVIISQRATTQGGHSSLDYLPGANLLGAVAAQLYNTLSKKLAYTIFHSGQVRFGNALPLSKSNKLSYPMPLCWHQQKTGEAGIKNGQLQADNILNYQLDTYPEATQPVQLPNGYIALDGSVTQASRQLRIKTLIDPKTGRASNGQRFGYISLAQGMRFGLTISADDEVAAEVFEQIVEQVQGTLRLGRSRYAEYGHVEIKRSDWIEDQIKPAELNTNNLTLWLLSDLALIDEWGQPTLLPTTEHFGLPNGKLVLEKSFIRSRNYSPFNGHYGRRELERNVLSMGSVLYFELEAATNIEPLIKKLQQGVGLYRQAGLGQVWLNPALLSKPKPILQKSIKRKVARKFEAPNLPLANWLQTEVKQNSETVDIEDESKKWLKKLELLYRSAHLLAAAPVGVRIGPSATQWGRVRELAIRPKMTKKVIKQVLFTDEHPICRKNDPEWTAQVYVEAEKSQNFQDWLKTLIDKTEAEKLPALLAQIARQAIDIAREKERKSH